jgi:hypothetical protein
MAGYSGTPLVKKIGIKPGHSLALCNHPPSFLKELGTLPDGVTRASRSGGRANVVVYFTDKLAALEKDFAALAGTMEPDGMLWVAWPKRASGQPTDLTEDVVRRVALDRGLVDVKVCAIDDTWSGLKLVVRRKDRPAKTLAGRSSRRASKRKER